MNILGIDTSTSLCSVSITGRDIGTIEKCEELERNVNEKIFIHIAALFKEAGIKAKSLDGIAVNRGPGSFMGMRVGMSIAKGFAHSLSVPIIGITSFELLAYNVNKEQFPVCCVVPIKNEKVSYAIFSDAESISSHEAGALGTWTDVVDMCDAAKTLCGDIPEEYQKKLKHICSSELDLIVRKQSAQSIAEAGLKKLSKGINDDLEILTPIYMQEISFRAQSVVKGLQQ